MSRPRLRRLVLCAVLCAAALGIFVLDGCGYFKKFDGDRLLSLNPAYPPILLKNFTQTACCGQVIGRMRKR